MVPEAVDGELLEEALQCIDDAEILYVAGDLADDVWLDEDEAQFTQTTAKSGDTCTRNSLAAVLYDTNHPKGGKPAARLVTKASFPRITQDRRNGRGNS